MPSPLETTPLGRTRTCWIRGIIVIGISILVPNEIEAVPITPSNILVSVRHSIREFNPEGTLIQTIPLNYGGREYPGNPPVEDPADIAVDQHGWINVFNGYWNPFLTRYSPDSDTFTHKTFPGWSRINLGTGGMAAYQNFVFATDINTSPGTAKGIVRFDIFNSTTTRFATGIDFDDLNIGLNGKLYALTSSKADIYIYDPATMQLLSHIVKPASVDWMMSIAADQTGRMFVAGSNGTIYRLDSSGVPQASRSTGFMKLIDIDVDELGRLIVSQWNGYVLLGDTSLLTDFGSFFASPIVGPAQEIYVCFAHAVPLPIGPIPTPIPTPIPSPTPVPAHDILVALGHVMAGSGVSRENSLREFSQDGLLLRTTRFNYNGGSYPGTESLRDITVDQNGVINAFNGTFSPLLTRFSWNCNSFTHTSFSGWSTVNNVALGGIAAYQNFIFVTDMNTAGNGERGIVRFDTSNNTAVRFVSTAEFNTLSMGLDGKLYAEPYFGGIDVYDPISLQLIKHLNMPPDVEGIGKIAIDQAGRIFMTSRYGTVYRMDNNAVVQASSATGFAHLTDIDIDQTGRIVLGQDEGWVIVGDSTLESFSWFKAISDPNASSWMLSVAFSPLTPAPVQLTSVVSEKSHGKAGTFDIDLPIDGTRGVECRGGGTAGDYSMIFSFAQNLFRVGGVCTSSGIVAGRMIDPRDPHRFLVNLTGVTNATYVRVTLTGLSGSEGTYSETVSQEMGLLVGDAGSEGSVDSTDISQINSQSGQSVTISNFRKDVNADGLVSGNDVTLAKTKLGTALSSLP